MTFDDMVDWFNSIGYKMDVRIDDPWANNTPYYFAYNKSDLRIGFCEANNGNSYSYIDGKVAIDRNDCFDKWSKCPICLPFPENEKQTQFLLDKMNWLKTEEGYRASNRYEFDKWVKEYPKESE